MEPAPYPPNSTEEIKAVICFLSLLDVARVKPDAKFLDRVPNLDGSVELVDDRQRTVGELKIQIKKIPPGSLAFDCPMELVAYSTRVSSPFLLVCVDVDNRKAFWCHVSPVMPGFKPEQKTFTVRFQPLVDEIGDGFPYFHRWAGLCQDYLRRVSEFPKLERKVDEEIGLSNLTSEDRRTFQQYIEEVNVLLDVDLPVVKHEYFADAWKLGVSVHRADAKVVAYSTYTIPHGENAPLVISVPKTSEEPKIITETGAEIGGIISFHLEGIGPEVSTLWSRREHFASPTIAAREFVLRYLLKLLRGKRLHVHGRHQSEELLMWFTREFGHTLGLPLSNSYKVADVSYGLNVFLPMWYSLAFPRTMNFFRERYERMLRHNPLPSFEQIANVARERVQPTQAEVNEAVESRTRRKDLPIRTGDFSFKALHQAVEFLVATNVQEIARLHRPWSRARYQAADLKHNIITMFRAAAEDYPDFVKGNGFGRLNSPLISGEIAIIVTADPRKWEPEDFLPKVTIYYVENVDRSLPLLTFVDIEEHPNMCTLEGQVFSLDGVHRKCITTRWSILLNLNDKHPVQATLYDWLTEDLERRFGETLLR